MDVGFPRITTQVIDLSTVVPSFAGVVGAFAVNSERGPIVSTFVPSQSDYLKKYTVDGKFKVGADPSNWSVFTFLENALGAWINRVVSSHASFAGMVLKEKPAVDPSVYSAGGKTLSAKEFAGDSKEVLVVDDFVDFDTDVNFDFLKVIDPSNGFFGKVKSAGSPPVNELQDIAFASTPGSGAFSLTFGGEETVDIAFDDLPADVEVALTALTTIDLVNVTGSFAAGLVVEFLGFSASQDQPLIVYNQKTLDVTATVTENTAGSSQSVVVSISTEALVGSVEDLKAGWIFDRANDDCALIFARDPGVWGNRLSTSIVVRKNPVAGNDEVSLDVNVAVPSSFQQSLTFPSVPDAGEFHLDFNGTQTAAIPFTATNTTIQTALEGIPTIVTAVVTGDFATGFIIAITTSPNLFPQTLLPFVQGSTALETASSPIVGTVVANKAGVIVTDWWKWGLAEPVRLELIDIGTFDNIKTGTTFWAIPDPLNGGIKLANSVANALANIPIADFGSTTGLVASSKIVLIPLNKVSELGAFTLVVSLDSAEVERFTVSWEVGTKDGFGKPLYIEEVLEQSGFIDAVVHPDCQVSGINVLSSFQPVTYSLGSELGEVGTPISDAEFITAVDVFTDKNLYDFLILMDGGHNTVAYGNKLITICKNRQDSLAILGTPESAEVSFDALNAMIKYRNQTLNANSEWGAIYGPRPKIVDQFNGNTISIPVDGLAGGVISSTALSREVWVPPAGSRRGVLSVDGLVTNFTEDEAGLLYDEGINPIVDVTGRGIRIMGQRTLLQASSALDRINVQLLVIVVIRGLKIALEDFLFELNTVDTRRQAKEITDLFLDDIKERGGVFAFKSVVDGTNNTPTTIDALKLVVDVFLEPVKGIESGLNRITITRTGVL